MEHDHPRRSPGQSQQHLQRPLAARDLAAGRTRSSAPVDGQGGALGSGRRPDAGGEHQLGAVEHEGQHAAPDLDARERDVRQRLLQRRTTATCRSASRRWRSRPSPISRTTPASSASTTASSSTRRSAGSCPASTAITTCGSARSTSTPARYNRNDGNLNGTFALRPEQQRLQRRRSAHLSGSLQHPRRRARASSTRRRTTSRRSCRTSGASTTG